MASEIQKVQKMVAVQMTEQAFTGWNAISVINFSTAFIRSCDSLRIHKGTVVWLITELIDGPVLSAF